MTGVGCQRHVRLQAFARCICWLSVAAKCGQETASLHIRKVASAEGCSGSAAGSLLTGDVSARFASKHINAGAGDGYVLRGHDDVTRLACCSSRRSDLRLFWALASCTSTSRTLAALISFCPLSLCIASTHVEIPSATHPDASLKHLALADTCKTM